MGKVLDDINFEQMLPASIAADETVLAAARALDAQLKTTDVQTKNLLLFSAIGQMVEPLISAMAWHLHVDYWPDDFTIAEKRNAVQRSLIRHMRKGTPQAVEEAALEVLSNAVVTEWWEYGGDPGYFCLETSDDLGDEFTFFKKLLPAIETAKNARSWLERIEVQRNLTSHIDFSLVVTHNRKTSIVAPRFQMELNHNLYIGIVPMIRTCTSVAVRS